MADQGPERGPFWTSLPGILTGAAALITAVSGLAIWQHNKPQSHSRIYARADRGAGGEARISRRIAAVVRPEGCGLVGQDGQWDG